MKLTTVLGSVNNNPEYYNFIPKQIKFWKKFNINFIAIFIGNELPKELENYKKNIILWTKNSNLNPVFIGQNIRIYYPALLKLPDNEMVMITDMDMLPMNNKYYTEDLEKYNKNDFVYYRNIDRNQIYMCYNAAHPDVWASVFNIKNEFDIEKNLNENYKSNYDGTPGKTGWFTDQLIMYEKLINYPNLKILNRPIKRLEVAHYKEKLKKKINNFCSNYDDCHFHRSFNKNKELIKNAEMQLNIK